MSDQTAFDNDSQKNIAKMYSDDETRRISQAWINATGHHRYVYNWKWMGLPIIQLPPDVIATQELIWDARPDFIVETGVARGGSIVFNASQLALLDLAEAGVCNSKTSHRRCIGIDIDIRVHNREAIELHPLAPFMQLIEGSSIDPTVVSSVKTLIPQGSKVMVILDSNHTHDHVYSELVLFAPLVSVGSYLIVHDTGIEFAPDQLFEDRPWGKGNSPLSALEEFLKIHSNFQRVPLVNSKLLITSSPLGYLQRVS